MSMIESEAQQWDALLTAQEVATLVRVHVVTFRGWCLSGQGPRETRLGAIKRYAESDVRRWIAARQEQRDEVA